MAWKNLWHDPDKAHHTPDGFRNIEPSERETGDLQRWRKMRKAEGLPLPPAQGYQQFITDWWQPVDLSGSEDAVWWLGHACLLLRLGGRYILIDPALSSRASPVCFYGPQRKTPSALTINDLPALDVVLISHNHYDHLDVRTIKKIVRRFADVQFIVPLGLAPWFCRRGIKRVTQLDWWEKTSAGGAIIHAVPARHWSMRTLFDHNRSLWCGWAIKSGNVNFWFTGDSGYSEALLAIPARLGPFNLAALPIGAYAPTWFMQAHHMGPEEAVSLHVALGQPVSIPVHWGVFELADESLDDPPQQLAFSMSRRGLDVTRFHAWKIGSGMTISDLRLYHG